ncbi:MAG: MFS transporter [Gemmatimonadaceae bacterium]
MAVDSRVPLVVQGHGIGDVLRRPPFSLLVFGQTISQLGDKLHHMALIALVGAGATANTGGMELAKLSVVFTLPVILFGPLAGALVDRWDKRVTMIICDALRAIMVAVIPALYASTGHLWTVYVVAFFVFVLGLFFNSAKMALIPELVERNQLLAANAALTSIGRVATVLGVVGGGVLIGWPIWRRIGWSNYAAGFYMDALSYLISVITLIFVSVLTASHHRRLLTMGAIAKKEAVVKRALGDLVGDVRATFRLVRKDETLRFAFGSVLLLAAFASSVYVVMTTSVQTIMGMGTQGVGYLGGLLAAGLILGSLAMGTVGRRWDKKHTIMLSAALVGSLMVVGSIWFRFSVFAPIAVVGGAVLGPIMVSQDTLLHEAAPPSGRGLVFSTRDLVLGAAFMTSALLVGGGVWALGAAGFREPYRLALGVAGVLICGAGVAGEFGILRHARIERSITRH